MTYFTEKQISQLYDGAVPGASNDSPRDFLSQFTGAISYLSSQISRKAEICTSLRKKSDTQKKQHAAVPA